MFKKVSIGIVCLMLMVTFVCFAAPRNAGVEELAFPTVTNFTNIGVVGEDVTGNPGIVSLTNGSGHVYYLYVDIQGTLRLASYLTVYNQTSFPTGSWGSSGSDANIMGGIAVGAQTN